MIGRFSDPAPHAVMIMPSHSGPPIRTSITSLISNKAQIKGLRYEHPKNLLNSAMLTPGQSGPFTRTRSICWTATERECGRKLHFETDTVMALTRAGPPSHTWAFWAASGWKACKAQS